MTLSPDDTQPRRPANFPAPAPTPPSAPQAMPPQGQASYAYAYPAQTPPHLISPDGLEDEGSSPGCLLWGFVALFCLALAVGIVGVAAFAGWSDGLRVGQANATATRANDIAAQCERIPQDFAAGSLSLAARRLENLQQVTPAVPCVALFAPTATALYLQSQATPTLAASATPSPSPTPAAALEQTPSNPAETPLATSTSTGRFDLNALLQEAQTQIGAGQYREAVDTLSAISAVDPNFQKASVDQLMYQALTTEARTLFRSGRNLAEAVLLTNRAEEYGDVGDLNYERFIASLYLEAQAYRGTNYPLAIRLLNRIIYEQNLPNYMGGAVMTQLFESYVGYGDLLAIGDPCNAVGQYTSALQLRQAPDVQGKRSAAESACAGVVPTTDPATGGTSGGSGQPVNTPDPNAPTPAFAPIGQPGG